MSLVHLVNRASALDSCLRYVGPEDAVLLFADGVYAAARAGAAKAVVWAIEADAAARGIRLEPPIRAIGYDGFVDLVVAHQASVTWT